MKNLTSAWVGRSVMIKGGCYPAMIGSSAVVIAVDPNHDKAMGWVKVDTGDDVSGYLTVELAWIEAVDTGERGPLIGYSAF